MAPEYAKAEEAKEAAAEEEARVQRYPATVSLDGSDQQENPLQGRNGEDGRPCLLDGC